MTFRPFEDRVLIKPTPPETSTAGLDLLSSDQQPKAEGIVIAIGPGTPLHNIKLNVSGEVSPNTIDNLKEIIELIKAGRPLEVKPGDYVMYGAHSGTKIRIDGEEHIIVRGSDVFGVIE